MIDAHSNHWGKLKPWLLALSGGKCWFSEVRELYSHYDVEHFRPKKEAKMLDSKVRDGYWWLAFEYTNFRLCGNVGNRKKGGWFPLKEESRCSSYTDQCEDTETAYLLDPIDIHDVNLLTFDEEGKVVAKANASDWEKQRVAETVKRLKLNEHVELAEERRKIWNKVSKLIGKYQYEDARSREGRNEVARHKAKEAAKQIREMTRPTAELSAVAKWSVLLRNDPELSKLVA
ncbi:hypothetical protein RY831_29415 [Noviherbaspirillum sp. CPCC 100848]|uniref:TIGR02646 family protein n=1 Tax=Noviherbaspirillum album TaxID=3080276 RepID=A0ABU6JJ36_9BURK|nr:hypothetical protein [Noviherbaspirillum sp. CPCC 100848]MEC4723280.1 hypothetical protein [Noviherbaspirillum sp. CPCC 100848]